MTGPDAPYRKPLAILVDEGIQAVQWFDFKGWEIRARGVHVGYVRYDEDARTWIAEPTDLPAARGFSSRDKAIRVVVGLR